MDRRSRLGQALTLVLVAGCAARPLRIAEPIAGVSAVARGAGDVSWTCGLRGEGTWIGVDLALANGGAVPVEWPDPSAPATVALDEGESCTIRVSPAADARPAEVAPGASAHLAGGFGVVVGEGPPAITWTSSGPTVAVPPGTRCAVVCSSVYWPPPVGAPPPAPYAAERPSEGVVGWLRPVVPIASEPGSISVTTSGARRVAVELAATGEGSPAADPR